MRVAIKFFPGIRITATHGTKLLWEDLEKPENGDRGRHPSLSRVALTLLRYRALSPIHSELRQCWGKLLWLGQHGSKLALVEPNTCDSCFTEPVRCYHDPRTLRSLARLAHRQLATGSSRHQ